MYVLLRSFRVLSAERARDLNVYAAAQSYQKAREERHQLRRRAHCTERPVVCELSRHCDVAEVEQDFQQLRQYERYAEEKYIFPERP